MNVDQIDDRAQRLMDQVMKTWNPPLTGSGADGDLVQTAVMIAIAYIFGSEFMPPNMTRSQEAALYSGLAVMHKTLDQDREPSFSEWMDRWEEAIRDGRSTISREEAERRYYTTYGRERDSRGEG